MHGFFEVFTVEDVSNAAFVAAPVRRRYIEAISWRNHDRFIIDGKIGEEPLGKLFDVETVMIKKPLSVRTK